MNALLKYEIASRAFELMTGMLAPGKDAPIAMGGTSLDDREAAWKAWNETNGTCVTAMLRAFEENATELDQ